MPQGRETQQAFESIAGRSRLAESTQETTIAADTLDRGKKSLAQACESVPTHTGTQMQRYDDRSLFLSRGASPKV